MNGQLHHCFLNSATWVINVASNNIIRHVSHAHVSEFDLDVVGMLHLGPLTGMMAIVIIIIAKL